MTPRDAAGAHAKYPVRSGGCIICNCAIYQPPVSCHASAPKSTGSPFRANRSAGSGALPLKAGHEQMPICTASAARAPISIPKIECRAYGASSVWYVAIASGPPVPVAEWR